MLQEAPDHADDPNILRQARNARTQAAGSAHDQVDLNAALRGCVERLNQFGSTTLPND
jgi:hypothetical protein